MKNLTKTLLIGLLLWLPMQGYTEELSAEKKQRINMLLQKTGAAKINSFVANHFINSSMTYLQSRNPTLSPDVLQIVKEEVNGVITEKASNGRMVDKLHAIYHKHLTLKEINEFIAFYETPVGKKFLTIMPIISQEGMIAARDWGKELAPTIQQKLEARLQKEGIKLK